MIFDGLDSWTYMYMYNANAILKFNSISFVYIVSAHV